MNKNLSSIDIAKFVGSIFVLALHCDALGDFARAGLVLRVLARWTVPFFFICSSYFLFRKGNKNGSVEKAAIIRFTYRIGILYLLWFIFNLPSVIARFFYAKDLSAIKTWLVFLRNALLSSTYTGSWYLVSSIFSAWCIFLLSKKFRTKQIVIITSALYLVCVLSSLYYGILPSNLGRVLQLLAFPRNIFNGCFYFAIGKLIAENETCFIRKISKRIALAGFILFYILFGLEIVLTNRLGIAGDMDVAFSTAAIAFFLFLFCLQAKIEIQNGLLLRKMSVIIYCCQGNVVLLDEYLIQFFNNRHFPLPFGFAFLISLLLAIIICIVVLSIQKYMPWKWTKHLT